MKQLDSAKFVANHWTLLYNVTSYFKNFAVFNITGYKEKKKYV
jgi:hypothetical protein